MQRINAKHLKYPLVFYFDLHAELKVTNYKPQPVLPHR